MDFFTPDFPNAPAPAPIAPPSKEMRKTQKVNKGPSALELVKKKYKGQIMDLGKK